MDLKRDEELLFAILQNNASTGDRHSAFLYTHGSIDRHDGKYGYSQAQRMTGARRSGRSAMCHLSKLLKNIFAE
jgi:hypothetical protein